MVQGGKSLNSLIFFIIHIISVVDKNLACYFNSMDNLLQTFILQFTALFFTIDAIGLVPIFISLTSEYTHQKKVKVIKKGVSTAFAVLLFFALLGTQVLNLFGITIGAFRIAGGILLLILAIELVLDKPEAATSTDPSEDLKKMDISVFPLAVPLLSGPASISMLIMFMKQGEHCFTKQALTMTALFVNMILVLVILYFSTSICRVLGKTGINILNRIFGIILAAMACQFIINGLIDAFNIKEIMDALHLKLVS